MTPPFEEHLHNSPKTYFSEHILHISPSTYFALPSMPVHISVLSDSVNLASRLEGTTKEFGAGIIISSKSLEMADNPENFHNFHTRFMGEVTVKGKTETSQIYEVYDYVDLERRKLMDQTKTWFEQGVNAYLDDEPNDAYHHFEKVLSPVPIASRCSTR